MKPRIFYKPNKSEVPWTLIYSTRWSSNMPWYHSTWDKAIETLKWLYKAGFIKR